MYNQIRAEFYKLFHTKALYLTFALILAVFGIFSIGGQQQFVVNVEERTLPSEKIELADLQILLPEKMVYRNGQEIPLNRHEFDTLVYLARHPGWVRSKEQIYEAVWTEEVMNYENAVMWCISQLRKKLEPDPGRQQYIHTVKGVGYKFEYHPISE